MFVILKILFNLIEVEMSFNVFICTGLTAIDGLVFGKSLI